MMGLETIRALNREMPKSKKPYVPKSEQEIDSYPPFPFPHVGDQRDPVGWKFVKDLFCDNTGMDTRGPAISTAGLKMILKDNLPKKYGYGVTEVGPFQLHLGVFKRVKKEKKA